MLRLAIALLLASLVILASLNLVWSEDNLWRLRPSNGSPPIATGRLLQMIGEIGRKHQHDYIDTPVSADNFSALWK